MAFGGPSHEGILSRRVGATKVGRRERPLLSGELVPGILAALAVAVASMGGLMCILALGCPQTLP